MTDSTYESFATRAGVNPIASLLVENTSTQVNKIHILSTMSNPKVYCLYTGGTIGCAGSPLAPLKVEKFAELVASQPGFTHTAVETNTLTLNVNVSDEEQATIDVVMDAMVPAIDSSSMTPTDWTRIAQVSSVELLSIFPHFYSCCQLVTSVLPRFCTTENCQELRWIHGSRRSSWH